MQILLLALLAVLSARDRHLRVALELFFLQKNLENFKFTFQKPAQEFLRVFLRRSSKQTTGLADSSFD